MGIRYKDKIEGFSSSGGRGGAFSTAKMSTGENSTVLAVNFSIQDCMIIPWSYKYYYVYITWMESYAIGTDT